MGPASIAPTLRESKHVKRVFRVNCGYAFYGLAQKAGEVGQSEFGANMDISINQESGVRIVTISGRVDSSTSPQLDQALKDCFAGDSQSPLVLDFAEVSFLSSAGLRVLLLAAKTARQQNLNLAICSLIPPIQEIFEMSGFMGIMDVHADREQALAAVAGSEGS